MKKLTDAIRIAMEKMKSDGIVGWGLRVPSELEEIGELVEVGPIHGCTLETCSHESHDPAAPQTKWIPVEGWELSRIGNDGVGGETYA